MAMDSISMCSNQLYVLYGYKNEIEVALNLNLNLDKKKIIPNPQVTTSDPRTPKSEPSSVDITV
jgi:hypothetical protein